MACYDLDRFREFVGSDSFNDIYELPEDLKQQIQTDELALMEFGFRLLRQVLFNEMSIAIRPDALDKRLARKKEREAMLDQIAAKVGPIEGSTVDPNDKYTQMD